jgi:L-asparaginase II
MTRFDTSFEPIAFATRSGFDESLYHGAAVALGPDGAIIASLGDPDVAVYPRSSLKPMQATAMAECGLDLPGELLAIVCASHDGTAMHTAAVLEVLATVGLDASALRNTPSFPLEETARTDALRRGEGPTALHQNCSGKHAGMLATCCINGWPTDEYLDLDHPLQVAITASIEEHGAPVDHVGIDGCGAPTHAIGLADLARSFAAIAWSQSDVARSMTARPDLVGGHGRDVTRWMIALPGLVMKDGADGVMAGAFPDGRAFALKIASGVDGARQAATGQALRVLGVPVDDLGGQAPDDPRVLGHGNEVGRIEALPWNS